MKLRLRSTTPNQGGSQTHLISMKRYPGIHPDIHLKTIASITKQLYLQLITGKIKNNFLRIINPTKIIF